MRDYHLFKYALLSHPYHEIDPFLTKMDRSVMELDWPWILIVIASITHQYPCPISPLKWAWDNYCGSTNLAFCHWITPMQPLLFLEVGSLWVSRNALGFGSLLIPYGVGRVRGMVVKVWVTKSSYGSPRYAYSRLAWWTSWEFHAQPATPG